MAAKLKTILHRRLEGAERVAVLAVGSRLRGDDAAGLLAADALAQVGWPQAARPQVAIFRGDTAPENLTGELRRFRPTHVVVLDAADMGRAPGHVEVLAADDLRDAGSFSTHRPPLSVLATYLSGSLGCQVLVVGIQPATCEFGGPASAAVAAATRRVAAAIAETLASAIQRVSGTTKNTEHTEAEALLPDGSSVCSALCGDKSGGGV
jgi:hydrogenase 3 maturation protease